MLWSLANLSRRRARGVWRREGRLMVMDRRADRLPPIWGREEEAIALVEGGHG
jgi:hypothetical protein